VALHWDLLNLLNLYLSIEIDFGPVVNQ